ncbi:MAG: LysM peptidoglycan-binding domain-containing protein, partial [Runella sp.]
IMAGNDDTAESLAKKSRVSFSSFLRYNDMSERESIIPAQVYYLAKKNKRAVIPFHTVTEGESLWKVSQIYGIRLKNLIKYNRIDNRNQRLQPGRVLWLTKKRPKNKPVEVIEVPQDEWKPGSNRVQPTMAEAPTTPPPATSGNKIPQNPSERRTYTPKMADTPADGVEIETPPAAANTKKTPQPSNTTPNTKPNRRAPTFNPSDDRVVIINDDDEVPSKPATTKTPASTATNTPKNPTTTKSNTPPAQPKTEAATTTAGKAVLHTVEAGQTFYSISKMYDVSINDILYWNNLPQDATLKSGQKLTIRPVGNTPTQQQPKAEEFVSHTVVQGETMFSISKKYNVTLDQIKEWNGLPDYGVKIGQQLKIKKQ